MLTVEEFYKWERSSRDTIDVKRCYIDLASDLVTGILLSQIIYWFLPGSHGSKLQVEKEGRLWLAKGRTEWWDECRITPKQFDRAIQILKDSGLVETKRFRFRGSPTIHVWLNVEALVEGVNSILTKGEKPNLRIVELPIDQEGENQLPEREESITETTTETTTKTTTKPPEGVSPNDGLIPEMFKEMRAHFGYPGEIDVDPIPNYGVEGKAIKRMLARGFEPQEILEFWKQKCRQAGGFKSMVYVNQDIKRSDQLLHDDPDRFLKGKYGHMVKR